MEWLRGGLVGTGVGVLALAAAVAGGAVSDVLPLEPLLAVAGNDYVLVAALGGLAFAVAGLVLISGRAGNRVHADMPDPERPLTMPTPGDDLDASLGWRSAIPLAGRRQRRQVRRRLRSAAAAALARDDEASRDAAQSRVVAGDWTADPVARRFLAEPPRPALADTARALLDGDPTLRWRVRHTVAAIEERRHHPREVSHAGADRH